MDEDDSLKQGLTDSMGRVQETIIINENGLYSLILSSKLPTAREFTGLNEMFTPPEVTLACPLVSVTPDVITLNFFALYARFFTCI